MWACVPHGLCRWVASILLLLPLLSSVGCGWWVFFWSDCLILEGPWLPSVFFLFLFRPLWIEERCSVLKFYQKFQVRSFHKVMFMFNVCDHVLLACCLEGLNFLFFRTLFTVLMLNQIVDLICYCLFLSLICLGVIVGNYAPITNSILLTTSVQVICQVQEVLQPTYSLFLNICYCSPYQYHKLVPNSKSGKLKVGIPRPCSATAFWPKSIH